MGSVQHTNSNFGEHQQAVKKKTHKQSMSGEGQISCCFERDQNSAGPSLLHRVGDPTGEPSGKEMSTAARMEQKISQTPL